MTAAKKGADSSHRLEIFSQFQQAGIESFEHSQVQLGLNTTPGEDTCYIMGLANVRYTKISDIEQRTGINSVETSGSADGLQGSCLWALRSPQNRLE